MAKKHSGYTEVDILNGIFLHKQQFCNKSDPQKVHKKVKLIYYLNIAIKMQSNILRLLLKATKGTTEHQKMPTSGKNSKI